jgi:carboxylesterase
MLLRTLVALGPLAALWLGARRVRSLRFERRVQARFERGDGGVIRGAEPIVLDGSGPCVLLLHGFGDTPQSLRQLAGHLHTTLGCTVRVPLLPGHGRDLRAFARARATDWLTAARDAFGALRARAPGVAVIGQSMGGALAVRLAAERDDVTALVLLAPYLRMMPRVEGLARHHRLARLLTTYVHARAEESIRDPRQRAASLGYGLTPLTSLAELRGMTEAAWAALPRVRVPTLMVQSREDNRIRAEDAERAFERLGAEPRVLEWTEGNGHVLSVDFGCETVYERVVEWLERFAVPRRMAGD